MKRFAVILSGCGNQDGSEIREALFSLLAIDQAGASYQCFAPNKNQAKVINHLTSYHTGEVRNIMTESARIARGDVKSLVDLDVKDFDVLFFPGGFGVALNLSNYALKGKDYDVDPLVAKIIEDFHNAKKPIGALCIAPILLAKTIDKVTITIGKNHDVAANLMTVGANHQNCFLDEIVIDQKNKTVTSPCYMYDEATISQIYESANKTVAALLKL